MGYVEVRLKEQKNMRTFSFFCYGCCRNHFVNDETWEFSGDLEKPTFKESVLIKPQFNQKHRCHLYIIMGQIKYLDDCTHYLKNSRVELKEFKLIDTSSSKF